MCALGGTVAYAYFGGCNLVKKGILSKSDQIMPYFVLLLFRGIPGMVGFYVAAVYSGTLRYGCYFFEIVLSVVCVMRIHLMAKLFIPCIKRLFIIIKAAPTISFLSARLKKFDF